MTRRPSADEPIPDRPIAPGSPLHRLISLVAADVARRIRESEKRSTADDENVDLDSRSEPTAVH